MRRILWLGILVLVATPVLIWYQGQRTVGQESVVGAGVRLTNRPPKFCPKTAKVVVATAAQPAVALFEGQAAVGGCELLTLPKENLNQAIEYQIFISIAGARAFRLIGAGPLTTFLDYPIQVGDVNDDNIINETDRQAVAIGLKDSQQAVDRLDVDNDGQLTVLDYSLVSLNQGAGVNRPDDKLWSSTE